MMISVPGFDTDTVCYHDQVSGVGEIIRNLDLAQLILQSHHQYNYIRHQSRAGRSRDHLCKYLQISSADAADAG